MDNSVRTITAQIRGDTWMNVRISGQIHLSASHMYIPLSRKNIRCLWGIFNLLLWVFYHRF